MKKVIRIVSLLLLLTSINWTVEANVDQHNRIETENMLLKIIENQPNEHLLEHETVLEVGNFDEEPLFIKINPYIDRLDAIEDYVGWIKIDGTSVDYPIVRGDDNIFYLDRNPFKEESIEGSIFMDRRNLGIGIDSHIIIYGHNMKDGSMFSTLNKYLDYNYLLENQVFTLENLYGEKSYKIVSAYYVTADTYTLPFELDDMARDNMLNQSIHPVPEEAYDFDEIVTLSTCNYILDNGRMIVHAIPYSSK